MDSHHTLQEANGFIERYIKGEAALHIHWSICGGKFFKLRNLCALLEIAPHRSSVNPSAGICEIIPDGNVRQENVRVFMLVDVRKVGNDSENVMNSWPTVVRLDSLDECVRRFGNPRKLLLDVRKVHPLRLGLDELERKLIEHRSELINDLASNGQWSIDQEMKFFFTVRIGEDFIRVCGLNEFTENSIDLIEVLRFPSEFALGKCRIVADRADA